MTLSYLINIIIKRRKVILTIFLVSVIAAAVITSLQTRIFRTTTTIMILPSRIQASLSPMQISLDANQQMRGGMYMRGRPTISLPTHKVLLKSNVVLGRVANRLKSSDKSGKGLSSDMRLGILKVNAIKRTNILQLVVENSDPKLAMEIANAWAQEYVLYSHEIISGEVKDKGDFIAKQFDIAKQNLVKAEKRVKDFKDKHRIGSARAELDIKTAKLRNYKKELMGLAIEIKTKEDTLQELKKQVEKQERFINKEINPIYQNLESQLVDTTIKLNTLKPKRQYLRELIGPTEKETHELEKTLHQKEFELAQLKRQVEMFKRTYSNLSLRIEEARIAKSMQLGEAKIISPSSEPRHPVRPKMTLAITLSAIGSLFFSISVAIFMESNKIDFDLLKQNKKK